MPMSEYARYEFEFQGRPSGPRSVEVRALHAIMARKLKKFLDRDALSNYWGEVQEDYAADPVSRRSDGCSNFVSDTKKEVDKKLEEPTIATPFATSTPIPVDLPKQVFVAPPVTTPTPSATSSHRGVTPNRFRDAILNRPSPEILKELHQPCMNMLVIMGALNGDPDFYPLPNPQHQTSDGNRYLLMCSGIFTVLDRRYDVMYVIDNKSPANSELSLLDPFKGGPFVRSTDETHADRFWVRPIQLREGVLIRYFVKDMNPNAGGVINDMRLLYTVIDGQLVEIDEDEWNRRGGGRKRD